MKILVGLSGGIDSAYAAKKLIDDGHTVEGAILKMHEYTDVEGAERVADRLGIPFTVIDCREVFKAIVESYFVDEYTHGRTPNPCIVCNREVKFRFLYEYAVSHGFDKIATGHYAKIVKVKDKGRNRYALMRAADSRKDQTYMLYRLPQHILASLVLPMQDEIKELLKDNSEAVSLVDRGEKESQEICFIPDNDYPSFIEGQGYISEKGSFIDTEGRALGEHKGIIHYTVGQRKGLGIALGKRMFVTSINPRDNTVTLSDEGIATKTVRVKDIVFSGMSEPSVREKRRALVKLRYLAKPTLADIDFSTDGTATVTLASPERFVTPGQSLVMYDGDTVIAGGFIE